MTCPTEYICAIFADGELPDAEAREIRVHLEECETCSRLVADLRAESRMLVQCLQDVDLEESAQVPEFSQARQPVSVMRFALGIIGSAVAFRLSTPGILFGFRLPEELEWIDPRGWALNLGWVVDATTYAVEAIQNAGAMVSAAVQGAAVLALGAAILFGMSRALSRTAASSAFAVLLAIGLFSSHSYALDIRKGAAASIPAGETVDDTLIATADDMRKNIDIAGTVTGDLLVGGDLVTISGTVEGNVIAFGRRVEISGEVKGSLVTAGQTVIVSGRVGRNLVGAGSNITLGKSSDIGSNAATFGGEVVVEGKTNRDFRFFGGVLDMRGDVVRNLIFRGGQASLSGSTHVGGDLFAYIDKEENLQVAPGAVIEGKRNIAPVPRPPGRNRYLTVSFYVWQIVWTLAAFIAGLILFRLVPALAPRSIASGKEWLISGGLGFLALVSIPIAAIIVGITVIGLPVALLSLVLWCAGLYFSRIIVAEFVGRSLMQRSGAVPLLAGLVVVAIAMNLPWIGGLISFLVRLLGLGAIVLTLYRRNPLAEAKVPLQV